MSDINENSSPEKSGKVDKYLNFRRFRSKLKDHLLVLVNSDGCFPFIGCLEYSVIFGACHILGYKSSACQEEANTERRWTFVCSTNIGCPLLCFNACVEENSYSNFHRSVVVVPDEKRLLEFCQKKTLRKILNNKTENSCCIVVRKSTKYVASMRYLSDIYSSIFQYGNPPKYTQLVPGASALRKAGRKFVLLENHSRAVKTALDEAITSHASNKNYVLLVAGGSNTGKSTFIRYFLNEALNQKRFRLYHLECDCGQSEFTVPGCLSLTKVDSPVFGDPFSHLRQPELCYYFGNYSPENKTETYLRMIADLKARFEFISTAEPSLLVLNTNGWVKGVGLEVLFNIIRTICPNRVLCFGDILFDRIRHNCQRFISDIQTIECVNVQDDSGKLRIKNSTTLRDLSIVSYFAQSFDKLNNNGYSLKHLVPYVVPWKELVVEVVHGNVPPKYLISVLNANVVALCRCNKPDQHSHQQHWLNNNENPLTLSDECYPLETFGFGIVRAVDNNVKNFYIITPLPIETVRNVNVLIKGSVCLPSKLIVHESSSLKLPSESPFVKTISQKKRRQIAQALHGFAEKRQKVI